MRGNLNEIGFLLILIRLSYQMTEQNSSDYYTAAVVEFAPAYYWHDAVLTLRKNTNAYIEYIEKASKQGADIIVFPEDGLTSIHLPDKSQMNSWTTVIPSAVDEYIPCTGTDVNVSETLRRLSCAARENRIYVVVNIAEKRLANHTDARPSNETWHYHNTNVVFDRTGKIIARYRKVNLYMEAEFDKIEIPEIVTFDTDFGVRFGTFICFDILFSVPPLSLTRIEGVSNIVYTTAWFSETPFLTAIQTQFGWSFAENVNLLVAGYHQPAIGSSGSGIYLGRNGIANVTMADYPKLLISRVPKTIKSRRAEVKQKSMNKEKKNQETAKNIARHETLCDKSIKKEVTPEWIKLLRDNITSFESILFNNDSMTETVCHHNFCCDFKADVETITNSSSIYYRAIVYNGVRLYGTQVEAGVRVCGLIQCLNESIHSCGFVSRSDTIFSALSVTARFNDYTKMLIMPSVLDASLIPFGQWSYVEHVRGNEMNLTMVLDEPINNLITFGIYARDFEKDKWN
uniref:vanin-like protein 1 n=1 Tax=Bombus vancouverensis nearcticus TaxID=2705178 RepID=UPI0014399EC8|nr:vanin-like protein 1 [Bombus vancouverensis nearcticus]XP_033199194.1 vanin-like protein 1 [Bombus vancouverensis nearcticus]XP_033199195.1 vanin-like protein 1 [Bombus vancouverensis nearcticus]